MTEELINNRDERRHKRGKEKREGKKKNIREMRHSTSLCIAQQLPPHYAMRLSRRLCQRLVICG